MVVRPASASNTLEAFMQEVVAQEFGSDLWTVDGGTVSFFGFPYTVRMVVCRLHDGSILLHSPIRKVPEVQALVSSLGEVRYIVSPNKLHHLFMGDWVDSSRSVKLYAAPGLSERRKDLQFAKELGDGPEPEWAEDLDQILFGGGVWMDEIVFFHRASGTLVIGDLIENHDPQRFNSFQRNIARLNTMFGATPVNYRWNFVRRADTRRALERMLEWDIQNVIVMHGACVRGASESRAFLERAFRWLRH